MLEVFLNLHNLLISAYLIFTFCLWELLLMRFQYQKLSYNHPFYKGQHFFHRLKHQMQISSNKFMTKFCNILSQNQLMIHLFLPKSLLNLLIKDLFHNKNWKYRFLLGFIFLYYLIMVYPLAQQLLQMLILQPHQNQHHLVYSLIYRSLFHLLFNMVFLSLRNTQNLHSLHHLIHQIQKIYWFLCSTF